MNKPDLGKKTGIFTAIIIAFTLITLLAPPVPQPQSLLPSYASFSARKDSSLISVHGFSAYDAFDRVIQLDYKGVEVIRIISPLQRQGQLPNTFAWQIQLPFYVNSSAFLTAKEFNMAGTWNVTSRVIVQSQAQNTHVESLIKQDSQVPLFPFQMHLTFNVTHTNERVFIIMSGHGSLEGASGIQGGLNITSGKSDIYTMFNWHPLDNDAQLTSTGVLIPYLNGVNGTLLSKGVHSLFINGNAKYPYYTYLLVSAFGVWTDNPTPPPASQCIFGVFCGR